MRTPMEHRIEQRLPPLQTLQTFSSVASSGSFTAAALELCLSQSAVSRQIQQLEYYFSCTLFERHTRKVVLTEQGMKLLPLIENILASFRNSFESTRNIVRTLNVRMPPTLARRWFLPLLPDLLESYPDLNINLDTAWFLQPNFRLGGMDVLITYGNGNWPGMDVIPLLKERLTPLCAPSLMHKMGGALQLEDLSSVLLLHSNPRHSDWLLWLQAEGLYAFKASRNQVFDTQDFAITAAASGYGVVMGDLNFVGQDLNSGALVRPFARTVENGYGYYAIYPNKIDSKLKARDFINWISKYT